MRRRRPGGFRTAVLCIALGLGGCGSDGRSDPPAGPEVPEREGRLDLVIGEVDGPVERSFGNVAGLAADDEGRIYVADRQAATVRVFGPDGTFLHTVGRRGQGPGELLDPCCLAFDDRGRLWIRDGANRRFALYRIHGADSATSSGHEPMTTPDANRFAPTTFRGDSVVVVGSRTRTEGTTGDAPPAFQLARAYQAVEDEGVRVEWLDPPTSEELGGRSLRQGRSVYFFWPPFGPQHRTAHGPDGWWAEMRTDAYRVTVHGPGGEERVLERPTPEGPVPTAAELDEMERRQQSAREAGIHFPSPERKQPPDGIWFDDDGRLWVGFEPAAGQPRRADLYDGAGTLAERRSWPAEVRMSYASWIRGDTALGLMTDSLGVQRVARVVWE